jgi:hypothetical protein
MNRAIIAVFGLIMMFSCTERLVCPAYQSAYIYDKDQLRKKFSYFLDDSTPKVYTASKNRYLVAEPMSYRAKVRSLQTVKMKPVPVVVPDSISNPGGADSVTMDEMRRATQSVIDSTYIVDVPRDTATVLSAEDSIYVITKDKELRLLKYNSADSLDYDSIQQRYVRQKPQYYIADIRYNLEQDHYMWYLRDLLVLPDVKIAKGLQNAEGAKSKAKEKKGLKGFFRNLFGKKDKNKVDSASLVQPPKEEFDYVDTLSQAEVPQPGQVQNEPKAPKKKGGLFRKKPKKVKPPKKDAKKPEEEVVEPEEKKKEDDDDGF